ncbi:MAG: hypothetical protein ACLFR5_02485 [Halobacteriales archaeon]
MFDDEELEQIREERDDWQGHVDRQTVKRSRTSRKVLFGSMTASFVLVGFVMFLVASGMMASALIGLSGIGGFGAEIGALNGSGIAIYPAVGPTGACDADDGVGFNDPGPEQQGETNSETLPQLRGEISEANVPPDNNLTFVKDIRVPEILPFEVFRTKITRSDTSDEVELGDASLYLTGLEADELLIEDAQIEEFFSDGSSDNPRFYGGGSGTPVLENDDPSNSSYTPPGEFAITGSEGSEGSEAEATIDGATARAHFIAFSSLTLPDVRLETEYGNESELSGPFENISAADDCPY